MKKQTVNEAVKGGELRYACTNWDPIARVTTKGKGNTTVGRKVITTGLMPVQIPMALSENIIKYLRQGQEVRLMIADLGESVRLIPVLDKTCKIMHVTAQSMGKFNSELLADKKVTVIHRDRELSEKETANLVSAQAAKFDPEFRRAERYHVSPDTVVTCPNCGTEFRVGKQLS